VPVDETPEQTTEAARRAGLIAARDLTETPSYDRWSAGTLSAGGLGGFEIETRRPVWPFVLVALLLLLALIGQLAYHYRSAVVLRWPTSEVVYQALGVNIPLVRDVGKVSIESSDLQADSARNLFVLNATLKNRADHAQAWPALELTLTDVNDRVVSRRIIPAAEYLPAGTPADVFPAAAEIGIRLWVEARELGATGYRLYIFYP